LWGCLLKYLAPVNAGTTGAADTSTNAPAYAGVESLLAESDEIFRKRLIQNFVNENQNRYDEVVNAINSGDIKLANRLVHNLKSNAGHLGKTGLQNAAQNVEYLLKNEKNLTTQDELNTLKAELDAVLKEIAAFESAGSSGGAAVPRVNLDAEEKRVLINKLELLLEGGNPECLSLIDGLRAIPGSEELIAQMENFDFDAARETLAKSKESLIKCSSQPLIVLQLIILQLNAQI
jgi:HPt (histidine-containing phosphotransfer) domain-containing protein